MRFYSSACALSLACLFSGCEKSNPSEREEIIWIDEAGRRDFNNDGLIDFVKAVYRDEGWDIFVSLDERKSFENIGRLPFPTLNGFGAYNKNSEGYFDLNFSVWYPEENIFGGLWKNVIAYGTEYGKFKMQEFEFTLKPRKFVEIKKEE